MADPISLQVVEAIAARLGEIATASGYHTDVTEVVTGMTWLGPDQDAVLGVTSPQSQEQINKYPRVTAQQTVQVEGHRRHTGSNVERLAHELIADIKRAALRESDRTLGGLCMSVDPIGWGVMYPEDGEEYVTVQVGFSIRYHETYGRPDRAA